MKTDGGMTTYIIGQHAFFFAFYTCRIFAKREIQRGAAASPALVSTQDVVLTLVGIKQDQQVQFHTCKCVCTSSSCSLVDVPTR